MVLILCVLNNTSTGDARQAVEMISSGALHAALVTMLKDVAVIYGRRVYTPLINQLLANPLLFLTNNRIKLGRGGMTTSGLTNYTFSWNVRGRFYLLEPPNQAGEYVHATVPGYNIAVSQYRDVKDDLHDLPGSVVQGNLAVTTQLSSCT